MLLLYKVSIPEGNTDRFYLDRPFFYAIYETLSRTEIRKMLAVDEQMVPFGKHSTKQTSKTNK